MIYNQKMSEKTVQKRRVRTDKQNRDYKCPCGKSYLSYPALYTHLKQKHSDEMQDYLSRIEKPATTTLERGRPKAVDKVRATNNVQMTLEYSLLSILQILTIELVDLLKQTPQFKTRPIILVGNASLNLAEVKNQLRNVKMNNQLTALLSDNVPAQRRNLQNLSIHFCQSLCKHFTPYMSARLTLFFSLLMKCYQERHGYSIEDQEDEIDTRFFNEFMVDLFEKERQELAIQLWDDAKIFKKILESFGNWMYTLGFASSRVQINQDEH